MTGSERKEKWKAAAVDQTEICMKEDGTGAREPCLWGGFRRSSEPGARSWYGGRRCRKRKERQRSFGWGTAAGR